MPFFITTRSDLFPAGAEVAVARRSKQRVTAHWPFVVGVYQFRSPDPYLRVGRQVMFEMNPSSSNPRIAMAKRYATVAWKMVSRRI